MRRLDGRDHLVGCDGRVASATRADLAEGAAVALLQDGDIGQVYEFAGDKAWSFDDLVDAASQLVGRPVE